jgi:hypothetical protein
LTINKSFGSFNCDFTPWTFWSTLVSPHCSLVFYTYISMKRWWTRPIGKCHCKMMIIKTYEQNLLGSSMEVEVMCECIFWRLFVYLELYNCELVRFEVHKFRLHIQRILQHWTIKVWVCIQWVWPNITMHLLGPNLYDGNLCQVFLGSCVSIVDSIVNMYLQTLYQHVRSWTYF